MANTLIAYPFTKSQRDRDKIMSEVMIASLVKSLSPVPSFILSTVGGNSNTLDEVIFDGYYFKLDPSTTAATSANNLYFYTSEEDLQDLGSSFPELYEDANGECLFETQQTISGYHEHPIAIRDANGFLLKTKDTLYQFTPYFIAPESDLQTKQQNLQKIWIKQETFNPYVYTGTGAYEDDYWVPLGAVYKSTT